MVIRKLSLAEWFLCYQLEKINQQSFHLPMTLRVDVTKAVSKFRERQQKIPTNALVLKALGLLAVEHPQMNRILFKTLWGRRFLEFSEVRVNFPVEIEHGGSRMTAAIVIKDPHLKSIAEIHEEIRAAKGKAFKDFPINHFLHTRGNYFFNRWALKALHFLLMAVPSLYFKQGGGGLSYSSLTHAQNPHMILTTVARGHTGFTFCLNSLEQTPMGTFMHFGVAFDHYCHQGSEMGRLMDSFAKKLSLIDAE